MSVPPELTALIKQFDDHLEEHLNPSFNEDSAKSQFIDPFFKLLDWDVNNEAGRPEAWRDVLRQPSIPVAAGRQAPDYIFKYGKTEVFILEAKKPSLDLDSDPQWALQARSYGWNRKLPVAVLTNFRELAVYDCRQRPKKKDTAKSALVRYYLYKDYAEKWEEITGLLSKPAVEQGRLDKFLESKKAKKGILEVDDAFLQEIEDWRKILASNLALRNPHLDQREINYAVQMTIDRIVFLRICEDRGIEPPAQLLALTNASRIYPRLFKLFENADDRYNSGLFYFRKEKERPTDPDRITPELKVDDDKLKSMIRSLYENFYDFSLIPVEILGHIYEKFLGNVIVLTEGHQARVKEKPDVKKAGGVYYTPFYVVEYIVANTVGKLLEQKTLAQVSQLKFLDPACGSGSFLLGAYQNLLDWHLEYYINDNPEMHQRQIYPVLGGGYRLTTAEKKRILLNNIYGVDIDPQAVEVTKLSLLLKVLENETEDTIRQLKLIYKERALPDLGANIRCGNSLIASDLNQNHQLNFLDNEEMLRINVFDWETGYSEIFKGKNRGFDVIIGNPPYGADFSERELKYLKRNYQGQSLSFDSYELFLLKASRLIRQHGKISMIIPASWLTGDKYQLSRVTLLTSLKPLVAYAMPFDVFKDAYIDTSIIILESSSKAENCMIHYFPKKQKLLSIPSDIGVSVPTKNIRRDPTCRFSVLLAKRTSSILDKFKESDLTFGDWFEIQRGLQPYSRSKHSEDQINQKYLHAKKKLGRDYLPELQGNELRRYWFNPKRSSYIRYCGEIASKRDMKYFQRPRIVLRRLLTRKFRLQSCQATDTMITTDNVLNLIPRNPEVEITFALGLLNSKILSWYYVNISMVAQKDDFPQVHISALSSLPVPSFKKSQVDKMSNFVNRIIELNQRLEDKWLDYEREAIRRQIEATDRQIDQLVYELYGLTEEEIKIVEGES